MHMVARTLQNDRRNVPSPALDQLAHSSLWSTIARHRQLQRASVTTFVSGGVCRGCAFHLSKITPVAAGDVSFTKFVSPINQRFSNYRCYGRAASTARARPFAPARRRPQRYAPKE